MANNAVAIKLPVFWSEQPHIWFTQAEAQFAIRNISSDETKYYHVVAALDQDTAKRVVAVLENPPDDNKYGTLKDILINTFGLSDNERASQLLHLTGLGDAKPSELMDSVLALLGKHTPCLLFRQLFVEQMPDDIKSHLALIDVDNYRTLAMKATSCGILARGKAVTSLPIISSQRHASQLNTVPYDPPPPTKNIRHGHRRTHRRQTTVSVTTIVVSVIMLTSAVLHVISRETIKPVVVSCRVGRYRRQIVVCI